MRVLLSARFDNPATWANPYVILLVRSLPSSVVAVPFSWRSALLSRYDVFHIQWPEILVRGNGAVRTLRRLVLFAALMLRLTLCRTPVVRTVHNEQPHEGGRAAERALLRWLDRITRVWIVMNGATRTSPGATTVYVPHGHYRTWYSVPSNAEPSPGVILFFGQIRDYKGVDTLIDVARSLPSRYLVRVLGNPASERSRDDLVARVADSDRVRLDLRFVPDDELVAAICRAQFVVLPYRDLHNSGALLMALSLNRPVIVPATTSTAELADEFGARWVLRYEAPLTAEKLTTLLAAAEADPPGSPLDMSSRDWEPIGARIAEIYLGCVTRRGHGADVLRGGHSAV